MFSFGKLPNGRHFYVMDLLDGEPLDRFLRREKRCDIETTLRQRLTWWPFHPIGYALATTSSLDYFWCPFFLAWVAKAVTIRYGGIQLYRRFLPFFLGLILGDYVVPALWGLGGMLTNNQQYMAFPH